MATPAKLVADLSVLLRGMRSHEGVVDARAAQARTKAVANRLSRTADRERAVADRVAAALTELGAPAPRVLPPWVPSPTSVLAAAGSLSQPLGEALVAEASVVRMLADRARVAHGLAAAVKQPAVVSATADVSDLYDEYAGWLVSTATALVVDEDAADLLPSLTQRAAGRVKDVVGVPARVYRGVVGQVAPSA